MAKYNYNLQFKDILDETRSGHIYQYNLAQNMALMSNDPIVIRNFYRQGVAKLLKDHYIETATRDKFMAHYVEGQAFVYFGLCPMIVQGKVNLVASNGFSCASKDKAIDEKLNEVIQEAKLKEKFAKGVYLESAYGDFLYRISYSPKISDKPLIDVIEPHKFEVNYESDRIKSIVIKLVSSEDSQYELREIWYKNAEQKVCVAYRYYCKGKYVDPKDKSLVEECRLHFDSEIDTTEKVLPFRDFPLIFKKNANESRLYQDERGVPDIQGLDGIEDALTESLSDLVDAIRKGGIKEYVDESLIPTDAEGNELKLNHFNKTIITTKGSSNPASTKNLWQVTQGEIRWEAYVETARYLMSIAINKAGLSPTTLGLTGLESINSSAESQEAREKTSIRTRAIALESWSSTLTELLNKYLQVLDYIEGEEILDYTRVIKIHFDEYISPSVENITDVLVKQVQGGLKSQRHAIADLNKEYDEEDIEREVVEIQGIQEQDNVIEQEQVE